MADFADFQAVAVRSDTMAAVGANMRRQSVRQVACRCAQPPRPRLHARPVDVNRPDVLALRFLIRQLPKLGLAPDRALDCSPSGLAHTLGRPTTALVASARDIEP